MSENPKTREFTLAPIGYVKSGENGSYLKIKHEYRPALKELASFKHANVLWWGHLVDSEEDREALECEKPYKNSPDKIGIFATRSPQRPNPIALTTVALLGVDIENGIIRVPYIDAEVGTPIMDIKPYHPSMDRIRDISVPAWCSHWPIWNEDSADFDWASEFVNAQ